MVSTASPKSDILLCDDIQRIYDELLARPIESTADLRKLLKDETEVAASFWETYQTLQAKYDANTADDAAKTSFNSLQKEVYPMITSMNIKVNSKVAASPYAEGLGDKYFTYLRYARKQSEIANEKNMAIEGDIQVKASDYFKIVSKQTILYKGEEIPLGKALNLLEDDDREVRKEVYEKIAATRKADAQGLDNLLSELISMRVQVAANAGCRDFIEYQFIKMGRFDYTPADCRRFHDMMAKHIMPVFQMIFAKRKEIVGTGDLRPWDVSVNISGRDPLRPLANAYDMIDKGFYCLDKLDTSFGALVKEMKQAGNFDLEVRKNKSPGGYMQMRMVSKLPFIFMNARNGESDVHTFMHELGHSVHGMLTKNLDILFLQFTPSEMAEVAAMSMENLSKEFWDIFYPEAADLKQAKLGHIERCLWSLLNACYIDSLQHWMYENPNHTAEQRHHKSTELAKLYNTPGVDFTGYEGYNAIQYQRVMHIFRSPFYFIEYAFSMLAAIAVWRNFKTAPEKTVSQYRHALSLGHTVTIPEFYTAIGASFDFTDEYFSGLTDFLRTELKSLGVAQ